MQKGVRDPLIELTDLWHTYVNGECSVAALAEIDLVIRSCELVAIKGTSGSGKSTLMNILGCLMSPTRGTYLIGGDPVSSMSEDELADLRNRRIGFVFQQFNLLARASALENVALPLVYRGLGEKVRLELAEKALVQVGLKDRIHHTPNRLSGGQQQRVAIARALVSDPTLILADEPTGNLDTASTAEIIENFHRLHEQDRTIVLVTHEDDVANECERIVVIRDGRIHSDEHLVH